MTNKNLEDITHIQNILEGNKKSEYFIYEKYKQILTDFLNQKYPQNSEYDDDVSEILIKVFISLPKYDRTKSKFKTWVLSIAKNYMIDKSRCSFTINNCNSNTFYMSNNDTITYQNTSSTVGTDNTISNNAYFSETYTDTDFNIFENQTSINLVSNQLESCDFIFLNMHYGYGYSYSEIGNEFNLTSSTVSNRVNYIKDKLKKCNNDEIML